MVIPFYIWGRFLSLSMPKAVYPTCEREILTVTVSHPGLWCVMMGSLIHYIAETSDLGSVIWAMLWGPSCPRNISEKIAFHCLELLQLIFIFYIYIIIIFNWVMIFSSSSSLPFLNNSGLTPLGEAEHVLVFYRCHNKLPQTHWLQTARIYHPTVMELRSPRWVSLG